MINVLIEVRSIHLLSLIRIILFYYIATQPTTITTPLSCSNDTTLLWVARKSGKHDEALCVLDRGRTKTTEHYDNTLHVC